MSNELNLPDLPAEGVLLVLLLEEEK